MSANDEIRRYVPRSCALATALSALAVLAARTAAAVCPTPAATFTPDPAFRSDFGLEECRFSSRGRNPFFILEPGYRITLESDEEVARITVLEQTRRVAGVTTRVVEELALEKDDGEERLVERSLNFFAICRQTGDVVYFGEDVEFFDEDGNVTGRQGAWRAGVHGARPGVVMLGRPRVGDRYYEEIAPEDSALDKAEVLSLEESCAAGEFDGPCLAIRGTNDCDADVDEKLYVEDIGVVADGDLELVSFGFVRKPVTRAPLPTLRSRVR
jgi:hypothetical protein